MNDFVHAARLQSDYKSMLNLTGPVITWQATSPHDPVQGIYPDKYLVTFNILAPTDNGDVSRHELEIDCSSPSYPRYPPVVKCKTPVVKHPHFFDGGDVCVGGFPREESLAQFCIRLARFLQFDPTVINPASPASREHMAWYESNKWRFPVDRQPLPILSEKDPVPGIKMKERRPGQPAPSPQPDTGSPTGQFAVKRRTPGNAPL